MINERLLTIIRVLWVILLVLLIFSAIQLVFGVFNLKKGLDSLGERLERGELPLPFDVQPSVDVSSVKDPQLASVLQSAVDAFESDNVAEGRRQLLILDGLLQQRGLSDARVVNQQLLAALDRGDEESAEQLGLQLISLLS